MPVKRFNVIDLFAGVGGLSLGFEMVGAKVLMSNEYDESIATSYVKNRPNNHMIIEDITKLDIESTFKNMKDSVDVVIGGPPCQAYSVAGRVRDKKNMKEDYRNYLFEYYLEIVSRIQPKLFVFENVPGMLSAMPDGTPIIDLIKRDIESKGYEIIDDIKKYAVLDASDFNVPQTRKRVILIGVNKKYFKNT